jgi:hypothetical protein
MMFNNIRARFYARRMLKATLAGQREGLDDIETFLRKHFEPVKAPMVLISQVQRSGGSLLSQLCDGHSQIAAIPDELRIGHPTEEDWPALDPALGAEENFHRLFEGKTSRKVSRGYTKGGRDEIVHPFFLIPRVQYRLFKHLFETKRPENARGVLDLYFTSYFNAWLNYSATLKDKRLIVAFAPRMADSPETIAGFFRDYPDGWLIQILREPTAWYPSARNHRTTRLTDKSAEDILHAWLASAQAMVRNAKTHGEKVIILRFEDLVRTTEQTMQHLAGMLGIGFEPALTSPSYLDRPMLANSSFSAPQSGVIAAPLDRKAMLSDEEKALIEKTCRGAYEQAVALATNVHSTTPRYHVAN